MAKKGERKTQKSISAPNVRRLPRKQHTWTIRSTPGARAKKESVPLGFAVRDLLGYTQNARETKYALHAGKVKVDGRIRRDYRFAVGLFDILSFDGHEEKQRAVLDQKGRIAFAPAKKDANTKLCKVTGKSAAKKGKIMLRLSDGNTLLLDKTDLKTGDTVKIKVPENEIIAQYTLKEGHTALLTGGNRVSSTARITQIKAGEQRREKLVTLEGPDGEFQTTVQNVFVVGTDKQDADAQ